MLVWRSESSRENKEKVLNVDNKNKKNQKEKKKKRTGVNEKMRKGERKRGGRTGHG